MASVPTSTSIWHLPGFNVGLRVVGPAMRTERSLEGSKSVTLHVEYETQPVRRDSKGEWVAIPS